MEEEELGNDFNLFQPELAIRDPTFATFCFFLMIQFLL